MFILITVSLSIHTLFQLVCHHDWDPLVSYSPHLRASPTKLAVGRWVLLTEELIPTTLG